MKFDTKTYHRFSMGDVVALKHACQSYCGSPRKNVEPGERCIIRAFAPKVRILHGEAYWDNLDLFAVLDAIEDDTRVGANICNLVKL